MPKTVIAYARLCYRYYCSPSRNLTLKLVITRRPSMLKFVTSCNTELDESNAGSKPRESHLWQCSWWFSQITWGFNQLTAHRPSKYPHKNAKGIKLWGKIPDDISIYLYLEGLGIYIHGSIHWLCIYNYTYIYIYFYIPLLYLYMYIYIYYNV